MNMGFGLYVIWWLIEAAMCFLAGTMAARGHWGMCITLSLLVIVCAMAMIGMLIAKEIRNRR